MEPSFFRREWGAVSFVVAVLVGVVVVPISLYFGHQPGSVAQAIPSPTPTVSAPASPTATPSASSSPAASPRPTPSKSP